jgi:hypothetical protein
LSRLCLKVFEGDKAMRGPARALDIVAYGTRLQARAAEIEAEFSKHAIGPAQRERSSGERA